MFTTADLIDEDESLPSCALQFRRLGKRARISGRIATVSCFEDNALIKQMLTKPGNNQVLVVDGQASLRCALIGDVIAGLGAANGWSGVIINGAARDADLLDEMDFHVKVLGTNPAKSSKTAKGTVNQPVAFGGVLFQPGHFLYSDNDGILVSERSMI